MATFMTDQQKVREAFERVMGRERPLWSFSRRFDGDGQHEDYEDAWVEMSWNTWQVAIAHASSATVKENLTVGEGESIYQMRQDSSCQWAETPKRLFEAPRYAHWQHRILYTHPAPSAEDARDAARYRWLRQRGWFTSNYGEFEASDDETAEHVSVALDEAIDQALAAERGEA